MSKARSKVLIFTKYGERFVPPPREIYPDIVATSQEFRDDCDPNYIIQRFTQTGDLPTGRGRFPLEGDFSELRSFDDAMNIVLNAQASFDALPSKVRNRFDNDPSKLVAFMADSSNKDEAVRLGLVEPDVVQPDPAAQRGQQAVPAAGEGPKT